MSAQEVYNQVLSENEYWDTTLPASIEHPLLVDRLARGDQSHTHTPPFGFLDFPNKRVMNFLTARK